MRRSLVIILALVLSVLSLAPAVTASPQRDLTGANQFVSQALAAAKQGDLAGAKAGYEAYRTQWLEIEDGIKAKSKTAYRTIEDEMANTQFAFLQNPPDAEKVSAGLVALQAANQKFLDGGYPADGESEQESAGTNGGNVADLLALLDRAHQRAEANDPAGAAEAMEEFRGAWLDIEGIVLTQSSKVYADAERDMVDAHALLVGNPPNLARALSIIQNMRTYLAPIASKSAYTALDAATIILREGLEALLVVVALLGFLKRAGHGEKSRWIWGGVMGGLVVSAALAIGVKLLFRTGAFGSNNFLIAGWTGLFAAVMLVYVSYWLHSKSSIAEWQRYIREKSTAALAKGSLFSLASLSFLAVFREGTETVLFYVGMASSISLRELLLGLGGGVVVLLLLAVAILKVGVRIPMRPFFLVSSLLVFYLGFKFTGMGIHGLQLAGVLPATVINNLPAIDMLAIYPNWQSLLPQLALLILAAIITVSQYRRDRVVRRQLQTQEG